MRWCDRCGQSKEAHRFSRRMLDTARENGRRYIKFSVLCWSCESFVKKFCVKEFWAHVLRPAA